MPVSASSALELQVQPCFYVVSTGKARTLLAEDSPHPESTSRPLFGFGPLTSLLWCSESFYSFLVPCLADVTVPKGSEG